MKRILSAFAILLALAGPIAPVYGPAPAYAAFKATGVAAEGALSQIRRQAAATKTFLLTRRALMVAPTVSATVPRSVIDHLAQVIPVITTLSQTPGLVEYAKSQLSDVNYDIGAEFTAMRKLMVAALNGLIAAFPKDANNFVLYEMINASGIFTPRTFTDKEVAPAVVLMDAVINSIE